MPIIGVAIILLLIGLVGGSFSWEVRLWITIVSALVTAYGAWYAFIDDSGSGKELLFPVGLTVTFIFLFSLAV